MGPDDDTVETLATYAKALHAKLDPLERTWFPKQELFEAKGYMLRPRYRTNWVPSWTLAADDSDPNSFEDFALLPASITYYIHILTPQDLPVNEQPIPNIIDATRIPDGCLVCIKRVRTGSEEARLVSKLSQPELRGDSRNHCVPVLDQFEDPDDPSISYVIMPFLRPFDDPPFETVLDLMDFVTQLLEVGYRATYNP